MKPMYYLIMDKVILARVTAAVLFCFLCYFFYIQSSLLMGLTMFLAGIWMLYFEKEIEFIHKDREYLIKPGTFADRLLWKVAVIIVFGISIYYLTGGLFPEEKLLWVM